MKSEVELIDLIQRDSQKSMCRICLGLVDDSIKTSLFEERNSVAFSVKMMLCTRVLVSQGDGLPDIICARCRRELDAANNFRVKCEYSDSLLKKVISSLKENPAPNFEDDITLDRLLAEDRQGNIKLEGNRELVRNNEVAVLDSKTSSKHTLNDFVDIEIKPEVDDYYCSDASFEMEVSLNGVGDKVKENISSSPATFICNLCHKCVKTKYTLQQHMKRLHSPGKAQKPGRVTGFGKDRRFHCGDCPYSSASRKVLVCHIRTHTGERPYKCEQCGKCFSQVSSLISHRKVHSDVTYFTCQECGKQFKLKRGLEKHKQVHNKEKNFKCSLCDKALTTQKILSDHMKRHYNIKSFSCETCGAIFTTGSELTMHVHRIHKREKRFKCSLCDYCTYDKKSLEVHVRRHTGERTYKCDYCEYSCYTSSSLTAHMPKHTKERKYPCPECGKKFMISSCVNKHMLRVHKKKYKWSDQADRRLIK